MKNENLVVNFTEGENAKTLIIREVGTVNELLVKAPIKIDLFGVIGAPAEFLMRRKDVETQINSKLCHVLVNRENLTIVLVINENDEYRKGTVKGILEQHPRFVAFGINTGKNWEPNELGQFCKMNKAFFNDASENMDIVSKLKGFVANIASKIEKERADKGDFKDNYSGVVTSNLPPAFKLNIPIFKGRQKEVIEVEFYASIDGREVSLQLYSPGACQALEDIRDQVIEDEIKKIRELIPDIVIIEQ